QARPDQQPEIQALQSEFGKAVSALKSSKIARGKSDALGVLPWYVIIGPPGACKSTALSKSGLQFPYLSAGGRGVKGVAGTRNCEWWLTNEAVILDTAGRYTTEDNDRDEWLAFLDMLARNRPRRPLNGLLVAVSVGDFVDLDEEGSAALGQRIRERMDEVMTRLKVVLPVYVLFTKCDLLAGFVETFGELGKNERGQIWGFTLPVAEGRAPGERFAELFDELSTQVSTWSLDRLAKARRLEDRERIFQFPAQFDALRGNLSEFIQTVFAANVYQDTPLLRGVYFTSGTQEGRPIDRVMRAMASAFGLQGAVPEAEAAVQDPKSYFLRDVFGKVIFKDQSLAVRSASASRRDLLVQRVYTFGGLALAALLIVLPAVSFFRNLSLVHSTRDLVAGLKGKLGSSTATLKALTPLRARLEELLATRTEGPPLTMRFGMWQGDSVLEELRPFYGTTVRDLVVKQVLDLSDGDRGIAEDRRRDLNVACRAVEPGGQLRDPLAAERTLNRVPDGLATIRSEQIQDRRAQNLLRMRSAEQIHCRVIDERRAEVPADQDPVGKRLHEVAKQSVVFVEDGSSLGGLYFTPDGWSLAEIVPGRRRIRARMQICRKPAEGFPIQ